jgi:OmpA-OmpF porin, OOP family
MSRLVFASALAFLLAACASVPQRNEQLEQARAQVQTLAQEPLAQQAAGQDLDAARKSLQQAEAAQQQKRPPAEVDHLAYLALRHAQAGEARVSEANSRQEVARAQEERTNTLMQARTQEAQAAQAQAESARREAQAAQSQLAELQAKQTQRGMVITLGDVLFDTGQATLKPGADLALNRLAEYLKGNSSTRILIEGHTDNRGSEQYNEELSQRRAQAVATSLESRGVAPDQVQPVGRGKDFPVATNATPEGRQQNRRVEIVFSDASGHFAQGANAPVRQ